MDASAYANAAAPILRNANVHQIIAALLRDLDHELDSPTPCACASLIIYCSPTRAVFRRFMGAERGFFAFRRLVVMITLFACTVTRDPDAVDDTRMTPPAIDLACSSIAFALEELVASHPETAAAVSSPEFRSGLPAACLGDPSPACLRAIARVTLGRGDGGMTFGDEFWLVSSALDRYGLDISDADASYAILAPDCGFLDRALLPHVQ